MSNKNNELSISIRLQKEAWKRLESSISHANLSLLKFQKSAEELKKELEDKKRWRENECSIMGITEEQLDLILEYCSVTASRGLENPYYSIRNLLNPSNEIITLNETFSFPHYIPWTQLWVLMYFLVVFSLLSYFNGG